MKTCLHEKEPCLTCSDCTTEVKNEHGNIDIDKINEKKETE